MTSTITPPERERRAKLDADHFFRDNPELDGIVYFPEAAGSEMNDDQVRKLLHEIPIKIVEGLQGQTLPGPNPEPAPAKETGISRTVKITAICASCIAILAGLWGGLTYIIRSELDRALEAPNQQLASLRDKDVGGLQKDFQYLRHDVDDIKIRLASEVFRAGGNPSPAKVGEAAKTLLRQDVALPRKPVADVGEAVLRQIVFKPGSPPEDWDHLMLLLEYISFINAKNDPNYKPGNPNDSRNGLITLTPGVMQNAATRVVANNFRQTLDWGIWTGVTFTNSVITFSGGPTVLRNVRFENCEFQFVSQKASVPLIEAILRDNPNLDLKG